MFDMNVANQGSVVTMSSREIAELVGKEVSHVHRDIRAMVPAIYAVEQGENVKSYKWDTNKKKMMQFLDHHNIQGINPVFDDRGYVYEFLLDRRHTEILITGYDIKRRAAVIDRWYALESGVVQSMIPQSLPEALRLAADLAEQKAQLENLVVEMKPDVEAYDRIAKKAEGSMCITNAAKHLQIQPKLLFKTLSEKHWIYKRAGGRSWLGYQDKIQQGLLEHKVTIVTKDDGTERVCEQVLVTAKGIAKVSKILNNAIV
ncbi:phage antirepressor KilAC domain-containing protein [Photorhabdus sp. P32]|uniref:phage antirepressor KilAC domain-containing protein n=1 Tax=Photorhabdus sp. P32 TaxID=3117549 RepID=UPI00311B0E13